MACDIPPPPPWPPDDDSMQLDDADGEPYIDLPWEVPPERKGIYQHPEASGLVGAFSLIRIFRQEAVLNALERVIGSAHQASSAHQAGSIHVQIGRVNGLSFSDCGRFGAASCDDGTMQHIDMNFGVMVDVLEFNGQDPALRGRGCRCVTHTHDASTVLAADDKHHNDDTVCFWAVDIVGGEEVVRFKLPARRDPSGAEITAICQSPVDDRVLTPCADGYVRLWHPQSQKDLDSIQPSCRGEMHVQRNTANAAAFHPGGQEFAASNGAKEVLIYDLRELQRGPVLCVPLPENFGVRAMRYNPRGDIVAVLGTDGTLCGLPLGDAVGRSRRSTGAKPAITYEREGDHGDEFSDGCASWAEPAWFGNTLTCGNDDGTISCWDGPTGTHAGLLMRNRPGWTGPQWATGDDGEHTEEEVAERSRKYELGHHPAPVGPLKWNPRYEMCMSACSIIMLWQRDSSGH
eukprot:TRINITY_DN2035_c1_g1_i1.p1 TRINITY_DN2035_c1_g1~~TRINITY_DN2035_c1_g1_i1.p1  ORF type:complete len:487 (+),score=112.70 TRINITY_DN2035_c1_g1_i1:83-1462(+)